MKYIFGPVPSRRLGFSLGVDLIPPKTCSLDCIYCEVGRTTHLTRVRQEYYPTAAIMAEISQYLRQATRLPDHLTLAGSGEPTLHSGLGEIIGAVKRLTPVPVAVLTNGTLLSDPQVRREVSAADVILPSLDTVSPATFQKINRPAPGLRLDEHLAGLEALREEFHGQIWLEVLLLRGFNDTPEELAGLRQAIRRLRPDRVQLNTAVRPVAEAAARPLSPAEMAAAANRLGPDAEIIADFPAGEKGRLPLSDDDFLETLARRPLTADDLAALLGLSREGVQDRLERLERQGLIACSRHGRQGFYHLAG